MLTSLLIALVEAVGDLGLQDGDSPFDRGSHRPVQAQQVILGHGGTAAVRVEAASQRISSEYAFPTPAMNFWLVRVLLICPGWRLRRAMKVSSSTQARPGQVLATAGRQRGHRQ